MKPYEYPDELYCDKCRQYVTPKIIDRTASYDNSETGKSIEVPYKAAVCPVCGNMLCERDQEFAFINAIKGGTDR